MVVSVKQHPESWLGVDVGWVYPAADSDGRLYKWTKRRKPAVPIAEAGPVTVRKNGRTYVRPAYSDADAAVALAKGDDFHVKSVATWVVRSAKESKRGIALENWDSFEKRKPAWIKVWQAIAHRAEREGVPVTTVDRAYTSLTCPDCGHKGRENRATRDTFKCVKCGCQGQADVIAARNIAAKAEGRFRIADQPCLTPTCTGVLWKAGRCSWCYRFKRSWGRAPTPQEVADYRDSLDTRQYRAAMARKAHLERMGTTEKVLQQRQRDWMNNHAEENGWKPEVDFDPGLGNHLCPMRTCGWVWADDEWDEWRLHVRRQHHKTPLQVEVIEELYHLGNRSLLE